LYKYCIALIAMLGLAGCGSSSSKSTGTTYTTVSQLVFVTNYDAAQISSFTLDGQGTLTAVSGSPFTADNKPVSIVANPNKNILYIGNNGDNTITTYSYDSTGKVSKVASHPLPEAPSQLLINSSGTQLYVLVPSIGTLVSYTIDGTSADLTTSSSIGFAGGAHPGRMAFDSSAANIYAVDPSGLFSVVSLANNAMTEAASSPIKISDAPLDVTCCKNSSLYIVDYANSKLVQYTVGSSNGQVTLTRGGAVTTASSPNRVAVDPSGTYAMVTSQTGASLTFFTLDTSSNAPTNTHTTSSTSANPNCIFEAGNGGFIFTANHDAANLTEFQLGSTLTSLNGATTAAGPTCGVVTVAH
jgi:6-phosphogluconolactonase